MIINHYKCDRCKEDITTKGKFSILAKVKMPDGSVEESRADYCEACYAYIQNASIIKDNKYYKTAPDLDEALADIEEDESVSLVKKKIDWGKIVALHNAGWKNKQIGEELSLAPQSVASVIYRIKSGRCKEFRPEDLK